MPSLRLYPLLVAGAACLTLAACGGDDDPPPQAAAPAQSESAAPTQTAPAQTPTTTAPDAGAPAGDDSASSGDGETSPDQAPKSPSTTPEDASGAQPPNPVGTLQDKLKDYAAGGGPASKKDAADVRKSITAFQAALSSKDRDRICNATVGLPEKNDAKKEDLSCDSLAESGTSKPQSASDRKMIASAKITVKGDRAIAELGEGFPLPFRKVDDRWRLDYGKMMSLSSSSR